LARDLFGVWLLFIDREPISVILSFSVLQKIWQPPLTTNWPSVTKTDIRLAFYSSSKSSFPRRKLIFCFWRETFGGKLLAGNFWRETFGGKLLAGNFWRETFGGKYWQRFSEILPNLISTLPKFTQLK
jgi:hypothetical protein